MKHKVISLSELKKLRQQRLARCDENNNDCFSLRVSHAKLREKKLPHFTFKCGCCDNKVVVFYDDDGLVCDDMLEIGGVDASVHEWRKVLLPLLRVKSYHLTKKGRKN